MKSLSCFLLSVFLPVFGAGCASQTVTMIPEAPAPSTQSAISTASSAFPPSPYEDAWDHSPIARSLRGEISRNGLTDYFCLPTGRFNISEDDHLLLMQMDCTEERPVADREAATTEIDVHVLPLNDQTTFFQVPFGKALVSVEDMDGTKLVKFHYQDQGSTFHHVELDRNERDGYAYSLAGIAGDDAPPIGHSRPLLAQ